jgi:HlyD family secretion protein
MKFRGFSKKRIIISVVAVVVVTLVIIVVTRGPQMEYETYTAERGEVIEVISATGSIAPSSKIELQPEVAGKVREVLVHEGDEVSKGDLLMRLESGDIEAQILAQRAALASAQARLAEYEAGPTEQEIILAERAVDTARSKLTASITAESDARQALTNVEKNLINARAKAETQIELRLTQFLSDLEDADIAANDALSRLTSPIFTTQGFLSFHSSNVQAENDAVQSRVSALAGLPSIDDAWSDAAAAPTTENVQAQYLSMLPDLQAVKTYLEAVVEVLNYATGVDSTTLATYRLNTNTALSAVSTSLQALSNDQTNLNLQFRLNETDIISAEIAVTNARSALNSAANAIITNNKLLSETEASLQLKRSGTREEVVAAQHAVVSAEAAKLIGLQNEFQKRRLMAPVDGLITLVSVVVGESLSSNETAILLNAKGNLEVKANISEIDIARVAIGDSVDITLDAFSNTEHWTGTVVAIQPAETVVDNVIFYETTIRFDNEDERLRSGMTANLDIETERRSDVVRIPTRAIKQRNGVVYVQALGERDVLREINVTIGLEADDYVEVSAGLQIGDQIVVFSGKK